MRSIRPVIYSMAMFLGITAAFAARADPGCLDFKWDVTRERALFAGNTTALAAGAEVKSAPAIRPDRAYALKLSPQRDVSFAAGPGRSAGDRPSFAGLVRLEVPSTGSYRISLDMPFWIDLVSGATLLSPEDFQGQHVCGAPHKIVVFALEAGHAYLLQLSSGSQDEAVVAVTAAPQRKL